MNETNEQQTKQTKFAYPFKSWLEARTLDRPYRLSELVQLYESETGVKRTPRAYQYAAGRQKKHIVLRKESLWLYPRDKTNDNPMLGAQKSIDTIPIIDKLHSAHNIKYSIGYQGVQPMDGEIRSFGRYRTFKQVIYHINKEITIVAFKTKLNVWVHNPKGKKTQEQMILARRDAYMALVAFAKQYNLILDNEAMSKVMNSHHVLEPKEMNKIIQQAIGEYEKEIYEQTGTKIKGDRSHPDKIEHEGNERLKGEDAAKRFEWLIWNFPEQFATVAQDQAHLSENHRSHVAAVQELAAGVKRQTAIFEAQLELFKQLRDMMVKP